MKSERFSDCLAADFARLREIAVGTELATPVPSCPGWTLDDLIRHVAVVYLHKVECMRTGKHPENWPPDTSAEAPLDLLDRAYEALRDEFSLRSPTSHAYTWYDPDQTVGFWLRRMAHETVIHRVDAELAADVPVAPIPDDLAADGIDELLIAFLAFASATWPEDFAEVLPTTDGRAVHVATVGRSWLITPRPTGISIGPGEVSQAAAVVSGPPAQVLLWLWNRAGLDAVQVGGDPDVLLALRHCIDAATQ